jgi:hypothetical protein
MPKEIYDPARGQRVPVHLWARDASEETIAHWGARSAPKNMSTFISFTERVQYASLAVPQGAGPARWEQRAT